MKRLRNKRGRYTKDSRILKLFFTISFLGIVSSLVFNAMVGLRETGTTIELSSAQAMERVTADWQTEVLWMLEESGVDTDIASIIISCESSWNPDAFHVNQGHSIDRGLWMINSRYHPEVSKECAYDAICATREAIRIIQTRGLGEWTCYDLI